MSRANISPLIKAQLEKLTNAAGGHRLTGSSPPIVIPNKPICSNASSSSSQSSSSYPSLADQMSFMRETLLLSNGDSDNVGYTSLPLLPLNGHRLEHAAARDRILVKNKRRQPIKEKLSALRETDDNLFQAKTDDEQEIVETKSSPESLIDLTDLDSARSHVRESIRPRDHSADHILSPSSVLPTYISSIQRSVSFKRPQEMNENKSINRPMFPIEKSDEHIYDNMDVFKQNRTNIKSNSTDHLSVPIREHPTSRLRPVTMHVSTMNEKPTTNEFEDVFKQLKKRASTKKEESVSVSEEPVQSLPHPKTMIEETPIKLVKESESTAPVMTAAGQVTITSSISQSPNRRKTVGGVHLPGSNKITADDHKPTPSWIDIAKQKQSKFQEITHEKKLHEDLEQPTSIESEIASKKSQVTDSSNTATIKENTSEETRSSRKSMYESTVTRRTSPSITHGIERESIRALKASNPNRINNLIQFFDK